DIAGAVNAALDEHARPAAPRDRVREWIGDGLLVLCRRAWPDATQTQLAALVKSAAFRYREHCLDRTRPYPKIMKILELLRNENVPLAVLSNKPHEFTVQILEGLNLRPYFARVQGSVREEDRKPNPALALGLAVSLDRE